MRRATWIFFSVFAAAAFLCSCSRSAIPMDIDGDGIPDDEDSEIGGWTDSESSDPGFPGDTSYGETDDGRPGTDPGGDTERTSNPDTGDTERTSSPDTADSGDDTLPATNDPDDSGSQTDTDSAIPYPPAAVRMWKCIICE